MELVGGEKELTLDRVIELILVWGTLVGKTEGKIQEWDMIEERILVFGLWLKQLGQYMTSRNFTVETPSPRFFSLFIALLSEIISSLYC